MRREVSNLIVYIYTLDSFMSKNWINLFQAEGWAAVGLLEETKRTWANGKIQTNDFKKVDIKFTCENQFYI